MIERSLATRAVALVLAACATVASAQRAPAEQPARYLQPEAASGYTPKPGWATTRFAVAAANPLATDAGYQILKAGGSAVDAAIAVQMVLALVEPQSSGIGGGGFMLHYAEQGNTLESYDGRETAPASATPDMFMGPNGEPLQFYDAAVGGLSVGVPG